LTWGTYAKNVATYLERDFDFPFRALVVETLRPQVSLLKKLLVWGHVLFGIGGFILLILVWIRDRDTLWFVLLIWLGLSLVFYFSLSSTWTFACLDRFLITCLPPILVGLQRFIPRHALAYAVIFLLSLAVGLYWNHNMIHALQAKGMI
jgi:hypothetical protein